MASGYFSPIDTSAHALWDRRRAAHLLRRAGFGAAPAEIDRALEAGPEATVEGLFSEEAAAEEDVEFEQVFSSIAGSLISFNEPGPARGWWTHRMVRTRVPLREKLVLFWHGHFATGIQKVENPHLMMLQNGLFRQHAWGNFRELVLGVARDPAMLIYLDGQSSSKDHPNENFARELMELFTCGIGNYTERDVLEAARAFTGWHREGDQFVFHAEDHDDGRKQILGRGGRFGGEDVIDILMQQPATARFISAKLLRYFATSEPSTEALAAAASLLDSTQFNIKWFLRELFLSEYFYSEACYRQRLASPAEFVVGTVRTLAVRMSAMEIAELMAIMGQELLAPPNVKGWDGEEKWINSSTWPARVAFARMVSHLYSEGPYGPHLPLDEYLSPETNDPAQVVDTLAELLMQGDLHDDVRAELADFLVETEEGRNPELFRNEPDFRAEKSRAALATILMLPEYHAC